MRHQKGIFLAVMSVLIIALLGFAALAVDIGRLLVLRSEIQNAADTAALAAAKELNGLSDARQRARLAARNALQNTSHFARVKELLNDATLQDSAFEFFCVIGSRFDVDPDDASINFNNYCGNSTPYAGSGADARKYASTTDADTHYVRISLGAGDGAADNFTIDFIFLPVLNLFGANQLATNFVVSARALAGRSIFSCNVAPIAICDPWEGSGQTFRDQMPVGGLVTLHEKGAKLQKGGSGFLTPTAGNSANALGAALADENLQSCTTAEVEPLSGNKTQKAKSGFNTRFGIYENNDDNYGNAYAPVEPPFKGAAVAALYRPSPHVGAFPGDLTSLPIDPRFGSGDWNCAAYWATAHGTAPIACIPGATRWSVYNYEIDNGLLTPDMQDIYGGTNRNRRLVPIAILSCDSLGLSGGGGGPVNIFPPDGIAQFFLTTPATNPPDSRYVGEFVGFVDQGTSSGPKVVHPNVQLYE